MTETSLARLREICLALPEAEEQGGVGNPTFKVRDKIFSMRHPVGGRWSMWCKSTLAFRDTIMQSDPDRFFVPPYVGQHGWIGVWLYVEQDWDFIAHLVEESYRKTAPKRLCALLDEKRVGRRTLPSRGN